jgi:flagellar operon protein
MSNIKSLLIPNISTLTSDSKKTEKTNSLRPGEKSEFNEHLERQQISEEINFSGHAIKRLQERNIDLDGGEYLKIKEAMGKLRTKGGHDSLVITQKAAYVVDVDKNTVVTAVDKNNMNENVFTKIDSTIFMM